MSEHHYKYTHDSFNLNKATQYNLLIKVNELNFSFAITEDKKLVAWADNCPLAELKTPIELLDVFTADYRQIITGLWATGFTLLPRVLTDQQLIPGFARMLDVKEGEKVYTERLDQENHVIYKSAAELALVLAQADEAKTVYHAAGWITAIAKNQPLHHNLYLNIEHENASILNFSQNRLRFYNTFLFKNYEELAYYCVLVARELGLAPHDSTIIFSGEVQVQDISFNYLASFFNEIKLNPIAVLDLPGSVAPHQLLTLAALSLCASSEEN